jgi:hypothetical protein
MVVAATLLLLQLVHAEGQTANSAGTANLVVPSHDLVSGQRDLKRRGQTCQKAIRSKCGKRCNNLCRNQCYIDNMAFFDAIPGCVTAQGTLPGGVQGDSDLDNDGINNDDDDDDDNDGTPDAQDNDVRLGYRSERRLQH